MGINWPLVQNGYSREHTTRKLQRLMIKVKAKDRKGKTHTVQLSSRGLAFDHDPRKIIHIHHIPHERLRLLRPRFRVSFLSHKRWRKLYPVVQEACTMHHFLHPESSSSQATDRTEH